MNRIQTTLEPIPFKGIWNAPTQLAIPRDVPGVPLGDRVFESRSALDTIFGLIKFHL